jgi:O-antigen ligase
LANVGAVPPAGYRLPATGYCLLALIAGAAVAILGTPWSALLVAAVGLLVPIAFWTWRRPERLVVALAVLIPLQVRLNVPGGWALAIGFVVISALAAVVIYQEILRPPSRRCLLPTAYCLLPLAALMSLWAAADLLEAGRRLLYLGWFLILAWLVPRCLRDEAAVARVLKATVVAAVVAAGIGLAQFALQFIVGTLPLLAFWIQFVTPILEGERVATSYLEFGTNWVLIVAGRPLMRAVGTFSGPPDAAQYLGACVPLAIALLLHRERVRARDLLALAILGAFLLLTFSRQAWLGMVAALVVMALASWRARPGIGDLRLRRRLGAVVLAGVLALGFTIGSGAAGRGGGIGLAERLLSIGDRGEASNQDRLQTWATALVLAEQRPILGSGLGNYASGLGERRGAYSHNTYLDLLVETGPLGLLGLLALLGWGAGSAWTVARRAPTERLRAAGIGWLGALAALAVIFFFDDAFFFPRAGQAFWLLLGTLAAGREIALAEEL